MASESALFDQFAALIGQPVRVRLQDDTSTDGVLYCIDPDTDHVALLCFSGPRDARDYSVKILLAHHVRGIAKEPQDDAGLPTLGALREELLAPAGDVAGLDDTASDRGRRERLCQFLTKNFVAFEAAADGSLRVFGGAATLRAPFRAVQCANEQLLGRLQQLLAAFEREEHCRPA